VLSERNVPPALFPEVPWFPTAQRAQPSQGRPCTDTCSQAAALPPRRAGPAQRFTEDAFQRRVLLPPMKAERSAFKGFPAPSGPRPLLLYQPLICKHSSCLLLKCFGKLTRTFEYRANITSRHSRQSRSAAMRPSAFTTSCDTKLFPTSQIRPKADDLLFIPATGFLPLLAHFSLPSNLPACKMEINFLPWSLGDLRLIKYQLLKFEMASTKKINMKCNPYKQVTSCLD